MKALSEWSPEITAGDVNFDGIFNIADLVLLQKWLSAIPDTKLKNWKAADFNQDNVLNGVDFTMMKRAFLNP